MPTIYLLMGGAGVIKGIITGIAVVLVEVKLSLRAFPQRWRGDSVTTPNWSIPSQVSTAVAGQL